MNQQLLENQHNPRSLTRYEAQAVRKAIRILEHHASYNASSESVSSPESAKQLAYLKLSNKRDEYFSCAFLTNRNQLIAFENLFRGTVDGASVHPRVVVRRALELNAAAVILCHNHPSGITEPSQADQRITKRLQEALTLVDVRVLDHLIIGKRIEDTVSFAEQGLI